MIDLGGGESTAGGGFPVVMRGAAENDGYNALTLAGGIAWRDVALIRTLSRFLRQIRVPYSQDYMWTTLVKHAGIASDVVELFHARFDPRSDDARDAKQKDYRRRASKRVGDGRKPRRGPHPAPLRQRGAGGDPHQLLSDSIPTAMPKPLIAVKFESRKLDRLAVAASALRNLRLFAARRRRAYALRQGGARRHPLVRPAAGFPHRDSRPGQGAAGQERGDRAGRRQRRLRAEADAEEPDARASPGRRHRHLQAVHVDAARHHRQLSRRTASVIPPADVDPSRRRRPLSRGRRRQGHRDLLRHRQRHSPWRTASGWATPSPRAARPATTTRRWASPRAAPGNRSSGISARWTSISHETPFSCVGVGDMSGDVFGNGMLRENTTKLSRPSTIATFSSIPIPNRYAPSPSANACSTCRVRAGRITTRHLISKGGGVYSRASKEIRLSPEARALFAVGRKRDAAGTDEGDPEGAGRFVVLRRHRHLCARVERRATRRPATAPTMPSASPAPICTAR